MRWLGAGTETAQLLEQESNVVLAAGGASTPEWREGGGAADSALTVAANLGGGVRLGLNWSKHRVLFMLLSRLFVI